MNNKIHTLFTKKNILFFLTGTLLFLAFTIFTLIVREDILRQFDFNTTVRLQDQTPIRFDHFFSVLSVIGRFEYTFGLLLLFLFFRRKITGFVIIAIFGLAHVIEVIGKTILEQPGPPHMFLRSEYSDFPGLHVHTNASYPSGHSLRSVFLAILFISLIASSKKIPLLIKGLLSLIIISFVGLMLFSRVTLGEHWTTDVIGGSILGASFALFSLLFL